MIKKLMLAIAALGLTAGAVPAKAETDFSITIGNTKHRDNYYRELPRYGYPENHRNEHYQNNRYPRCDYREVLVQDRYGRVFCMDKQQYKRYYRNYHQNEWRGYGRDY